MPDVAPPAAETADAFRRALRWARRLFMPLAWGFLALAAITAWEPVAAIAAQVRVMPLVAATVCWIAAQLLVPALSTVLLQGLAPGAAPGYATMLAIHANRLPARYLPGGVWQTVSRMVDLHAMGHDRWRLAALVAYENLLPLAIALLLAGACLLSPATVRPAGGALVVGATLLAGLPPLVRRFAGGAIAPRALVRAAGVGTLFWLLASAAFVLYWNAFPAEAALPIRDVAGAYLLAWAAGFAAVFAPQGVGVFEAIAAVQLRGALPFAGVALLVAGFRAVTLLADLALFGLQRAIGRSARTPV